MQNPLTDIRMNNHWFNAFCRGNEDAKTMNALDISAGNRQKMEPEQLTPCYLQLFDRYRHL